MGVKLSKKDLFYLSDIAWWLKGYIASKKEEDGNDFGQEHFDVMIKVIENSDREEYK